MSTPEARPEVVEDARICVPSDEWFNQLRKDSTLSAEECSPYVGRPTDRQLLQARLNGLVMRIHNRRPDLYATAQGCELRIMTDHESTLYAKERIVAGLSDAVRHCRNLATRVNRNALTPEQRREYDATLSYASGLKLRLAKESAGLRELSK